MRRKNQLILGLVFVGLGCGNLSNDVFLGGEGVVVGRILVDGAPLEDAEVYLLGAPSIATRTDRGGDFRLEDVPVGPQTLIAADGKGHGLSFDVLVVDERESDKGSVELLPTSSLFGRALRDGEPVRGAEIALSGTRIRAATAFDGEFVLLEVPSGCFELLAVAEEDWGARTVCVEGDVRVDVELSRSCQDAPSRCEDGQQSTDTDDEETDSSDTDTESATDSDTDTRSTDSASDSESDPPTDTDTGYESCGGFVGKACPGAEICVDDPSDDCDPLAGGADCMGICVDIGALDSCGGFAGFECPEGTSCVDDPTDDCVPGAGGADCAGVCV